MGEDSKIEWTDHTFNPWIGCTKVSPACDHCYAEAWDRRFTGGARWGAKAPRTRTKSWSGPRKWNRLAEGASRRPRVFCASLADVFDNHRSIEDKWRLDLWDLIRECSNLDWLLLTKRPQNIAKFLPADWGWSGWPHVWLGTTVENQDEVERRIPHLLRIPARVRFLSCEPLLSQIDLRGLAGIHWVIAGGESGQAYRPADMNWFRNLRNQCASAGVPFLLKQFEGKTRADIEAMGRRLDGVEHTAFPND